MKVPLLYEVLLGDLVRYPITAKRVITVTTVCFRNCFRNVRVVVGEPQCSQLPLFCDDVRHYIVIASWTPTTPATLPTEEVVASEALPYIQHILDTNRLTWSEYRCNEGLKAKAEGSIRLGYSVCRYR